MLVVNKDYELKKTIFGRRYLSNVVTGDVIDINDTTEDIIKKLKSNSMEMEDLIDMLCKEYSANYDEIASDTTEIILQLKDLNVIL